MCASILSLYSTFQIRRPSTVSVNRRGSISNLFNKTVMRRKSSVVHMFTLIMHKTIYYQERRVGIGVPLTGLTPATFWCLSQHRTWIFNVICRGIFVFRWEVIVRCVDTGRIDDHHCLSFFSQVSDISISNFPFSLYISIKKNTFVCKKKKYIHRSFLD
jgi:hypothetical protein